MERCGPPKPKTGDASVLVKNVKDGTIAGKADLQRVKPTPAELIGPVAWEAMALATQQHYLAEISEKLDGIQHGVDEVLAQLNDDRVGSLNHWSEVAASAQAAARRDGRLSETRLAEVREGALRTKELWHQITTTARRQLEQYASGKSSPTEVEGTFQILAHAVHVLTQCSDALTTLPYRDADQLEATLSAEQDRMHPVLPEFVKLCGDLLEASEAWERRHADYEAVRPTNRVARLVRIPGVLLNRDEGKFGVEVTVRPKQKPLEAAQAENLRAVIDSSTHTAHLLLAEVVEDGSVLVGCVMPGRSSLADGPTD